jgi:hypothetical protein
MGLVSSCIQGAVMAMGSGEWCSRMVEACVHADARQMNERALARVRPELRPCSPRRLAGASITQLLVHRQAPMALQYAPLI